VEGEGGSAPSGWFMKDNIIDTQVSLTYKHTQWTEFEDHLPTSTDKMILAR